MPMNNQLNYHTFRNPGRRWGYGRHFPSGHRRRSRQASLSQPSHSHQQRQDSDDDNAPASLPLSQMAVLAVIGLAEQTSLNSISPYLPLMASTFPEVSDNLVGLYVGLIASGFALAQFSTNFFWGWLSDRIGRKPVVLMGTVLTATCFAAFGFCRKLWQALTVHVLMGMVNGNQGIVPTCLGEITDRRNQSRAFTYLPVIDGISAIAGPILGGLLVSDSPEDVKYPFLWPNLVCACLLGVDFVVTFFFLEESCQEPRPLPRFVHKTQAFFASLIRKLGYCLPSSRHHRYRSLSHGEGLYQGRWTEVISGNDSDSESTHMSPRAPPYRGSNSREELSYGISRRDTVLLFATYALFSLSNVSFSALYPIFAQGAPPSGRDLSPEEIGLSLGFAGISTIVFQLFIFSLIRGKFGNQTTYRASHFIFVISFLLMPLVGYKDADSPEGTVKKQDFLLGAEICSVLLVKNIAAVGGTTSSLLLITNSAPNHSVLGALNGFAQTLAAAGRTIAPFLSGSLFTLARKVNQGEILVFWIFSAVSLIGFLLSFGIRSSSLEDDAWRQSHSQFGRSKSSSDDDDYDDYDGDHGYRTVL